MRIFNDVVEFIDINCKWEISGKIFNVIWKYYCGDIGFIYGENYSVI